jgi:phosphoribosylformylglycinamidine cyclo-ligase
MPGMYADGDYDLAGFAVGAVERGQALDGQNIVEGDLVIGLPSSGVHSNGYSLVRKLVEQSGVAWDAPAPFDSSKTLGEALLAPTVIYVQPALKLVRAGAVKGFAHITGGGLTENIPRVLPDSLGVKLDANDWPLLPVFRWMAKVGGLPAAEMARTFNCGIGMVALVSVDRRDEALKLLEGTGARPIGSVVKAAGEHRVEIANTDSAWQS